MPRPLKIDRSRRLEAKVPETIHTKVMAELYSEVEGRVPFGAASELVTELLKAWLKSRGVVV